MRLAIGDVPEDVRVVIRDKRATLKFGDPANPTRVVVATDGTDLILFPDRTYRHEELAKALGLKS